MDVYTDGRIETFGIVALLLAMLPEKRAAMIAGLSVPETSVDQARLAAIIERYPAPNLAGVERAKAFCRRYRATGFETAVLELMTPVDQTAWRERR